MPAKKLQDIAIIAIFIIALLIPIVTFNREPGKISETENRQLAQFPQIFNRNGRLMAGLKTSLTSWFEDNLGMRETLVQANANIQYGVLHRSPSEKVVLGNDSWLFYASENNLEIAKGTYTLTETNLLNIKKYHEDQLSRLAVLGIEYAVVFPPAKTSIYPEMLSSGDYTVGVSPCDIVMEYLSDTPLKVINLKSALLRAKEDAQVYYSTDSHWNNQGAYAGYVQIVRSLSEWGILDGAPKQVSLVPASHKGDLVKLMGNPTLISDEGTLHTQVDHPNARKLDSGPLFEKLAEIKELNALHDIVAYENPSVQGRRMLIIGDSMFGYTMPGLLAENASLVVFSWDPDRRVGADLLDAINPDVVLYEMAERNFNSFHR